VTDNQTTENLAKAVQGVMDSRGWELLTKFSLVMCPVCVTLLFSWGAWSTAELMGKQDREKAEAAHDLLQSQIMDVKLELHQIHANAKDLGRISAQMNKVQNDLADLQKKTADLLAELRKLEGRLMAANMLNQSRGGS
jgi:septal ring factor EnvC (AmiA/AmiB activator)